MGRLSRSTVRCNLRPWEDPWTPWTPWTHFQCQGALGCEATATWGQSTRAVLERKREREGGHCCYFHLPHQEHLPPLWEQFKAAQVKIKIKLKLKQLQIKVYFILSWIILELCKVFQIPPVSRGHRILSSFVWKEGWCWVFSNQLECDCTLLMRCWKYLITGESWSPVFHRGWRARAWCRRVLSADKHSGLIR